MVFRKTLILPRLGLGYSCLHRMGVRVARQEFKPEYMARKMFRLYPDLASEIASSLMRDAMKIGESRRAELWRDVLARIARMQKKRRDRLH
jgi:hypothetical protein